MLFWILHTGRNNHISYVPDKINSCYNILLMMTYDAIANKVA